MIIVIQCAGSKVQGAGHLRAPDGRLISFVAHPESAPRSERIVYAHPDGPTEGGLAWRQVVLQINQTTQDSPLRLCRAYELYDRPIYAQLVESLGVERVYILSAGWGLIRSDFLTPYYDITFKKLKDQPYKVRLPRDRYADFQMLPNDAEKVVFLGGKDYLPHFDRLTAHLQGERIIVYNSDTLPQAPNCRLVRFPTRTRTNWHYSCAEALLRGEFRL